MQVPSSSDGRNSKASVAFIMNNACSHGEDQSQGVAALEQPLTMTRSTMEEALVSVISGRSRLSTNDEKRKARECKVDGCENYIINKGLCFRHGGGKKCSAEGCQSSAKNSGLCWRHGGWVKCQMKGCQRRGKSRGLCWSHGGGTKCSQGDCSKVAVSNSLCWAHGGGKRCAFQGCKKAAYERNNNYCAQHHEQQKGDMKTESA